MYTKCSNMFLIYSLFHTYFIQQNKAWKWASVSKIIRNNQFLNDYILHLFVLRSQTKLPKQHSYSYHQPTFLLFEIESNIRFRLYTDCI